MFRGKLKVAITGILTASLVFASTQSAQAGGATVTQAIAASFYSCTKSASWMQNPSKWNLRYPYAVGGRYIVFAVTKYGPFELSLKPGSGNAIVYPYGNLSKKLWIKSGCSKGYKTKVWYAYVDSLFNGGGAMD